MHQVNNSFQGITIQRVQATETSPEVMSLTEVSMQVLIIREFQIHLLPGTPLRPLILELIWKHGMACWEFPETILAVTVKDFWLHEAEEFQL